MRLRSSSTATHKRLVRYVVGLGAARADAEDIAGQAFAKLLQLEDPESISQLPAFLYKIAKNIACNKHRHLAMQQRHAPFLEAEHSEPSPSVRRNVEKGMEEIQIAILAVEGPAEEARK